LAREPASRVGVKVADGVRAAKDAVRYLVLVRETSGPDWLTPDYFRIGASGRLNDLLMQRQGSSPAPTPARTTSPWTDETSCFGCRMPRSA